MKINEWTRVILCVSIRAVEQITRRASHIFHWRFVPLPDFHSIVEKKAWKKFDEYVGDHAQIAHKKYAKVYAKLQCNL